MVMYKQHRTFMKGGKEMTGIQFFKNTAGNIYPSQIAQDMGIQTNGEFFLQKGVIVAGMFGNGNGFLAVDPDAGLKIPPYVKRIPVVTGFQPTA